MSSYSYSSTSYSSSSTTSGGQTRSQSYSTEQRSDPSGTTVRHTSQNNGQPTVQETRYYDAGGRELPANAQGGRIEGAYGSSNGGSNGQARIEDVTDRDDGYRPPHSGESDADRLYRERMEDEYAKREGGS